MVAQDGQAAGSCARNVLGGRNIRCLLGGHFLIATNHSTLALYTPILAAVFSRNPTVYSNGFPEMDEEGGNILGAIYDEDDHEDIYDDVEMVDVEDGEIVDSVAGGGEGADDGTPAKQEPRSKNRRRRANERKNKRKNKRKRGSSPCTDIDRFVLDTCRRLKEKKSYMVYTAVGCLGVAALSDLVREVDAIQACGGQMTADGKRNRTGGGVLWSIIKAREPDAYQKIMKGAKEFEKLFRSHHVRQRTDKVASSHGSGEECAEEQHPSAPLDGSSQITPVLNSNDQSAAEEKRRPVKDRIRVPVSYDDITGDPGDEANQQQYRGIHPDI
ncbi:hypothetical protein MLD38_015249 [Melastoma candidum]|uniref:Uncharacterized protein n=1 Tax=Melastoma candidum TaxID=119954 RepID=A0ACB9RGV5_9MYRT|nr:hypothetical protein MLD38_015249 [Melastoma candidum]